MRNVFHHIKKPIPYFEKLKMSVKNGGRIAIIDWKRACAQVCRICRARNAGG